MTSKRRPRFVREGSVGLLAIAGIAVLGAAGFWLKGHTFGEQSYKIFVDFFAVSGLQIGSPVRFRGIKIGRVTTIRPGANSAEIELAISPPTTIIPRGVVVEANQSGLISETTIDFTPLQQNAIATNSVNSLTSKPADANCDRAVMICNGDHLKGNIGVSFDQLIRTSVRFAEVYGDPVFIKNLNQALSNASIAAANLATLGTEMTSTARSLKSNLNSSSQSLQTNLTSLQTNVSGLSQDLRGQVPALSTSVRSVGQAADRISATTAELGGILDKNRTQIQATLNNFSEASGEFKVALARISPILQKVEQGKMLENLSTFSDNAAKASVSLRELVSTASNPGTLVVLYQLLDSARATFQNTQKLTSDLDEVTGDPIFRRNLRELVKGLSKLISSAETLDQQTQVARLLSPKNGVSVPDSDSFSLELSKDLPPKIATLIAPLQLAEPYGTKQPQPLFSTYPLPESPIAARTQTTQALLGQVSSIFKLFNVVSQSAELGNRVPSASGLNSTAPSETPIPDANPLARDRKQYLPN